jgi:hypothetical protein
LGVFIPLENWILQHIYFWRGKTVSEAKKKAYNFKK